MNARIADVPTVRETLQAVLDAAQALDYAIDRVADLVIDSGEPMAEEWVRATLRICDVTPANWALVQATDSAAQPLYSAIQLALVHLPD